MEVLVTGAAGFIGSHLCEALLDAGNSVRGLDAFTGYYSRASKEKNVARLRRHPGFRLVEADLAEVPLTSFVTGVDTVFHLAGQPGVRTSWGPEFDFYVRHNIVATQRLLEACRGRQIRKLVYASSSSVYGHSEKYPTPETLSAQPFSPYGVTKLAAEHLCGVYNKNFNIPIVSLRLFSVYGPRQRPDMAFARLIRAALSGTEFELFGDGGQTRDFTFVDDVVNAMQGAAKSPWCGIANIGGGSRTSLNNVIEIVEGLCDNVAVHRGRRVPGDIRHTAADTSVATANFGYRPRTSLPEGLAAMVAWDRSAEKVLIG